MKKLLTIFFLLYTVAATAQSFNNEWIDYNKTYYKFKVGTTGLYRIPQTALAAINLGNTDVAAFQLWRNGEEVAIYTSNQTGVLAAGGFIEFWGEANDGKADQALYRNPLDHINNSKSLFTDTAAYFLTINAAGSNKRLVPTANTIPAGAVTEPYFMHTASINPNEAIHLGPYAGTVSEPAVSASFEGGEGWTSGEIDQNQSRTISQSGMFPFTGSGAPQMQISMNVVGNSANSRSVQMKLNNTDIFNVTLNGFDYSRLTNTIPVSVLNGSSESILVSNISTVPNNRIKIAGVEITYPRFYNFGGASNFRFKVAVGAGKYLEVSGFNTLSSPVALYDLANGRRYDADLTTPSVVKIYLQPSTIAPDLVLAGLAATNIKTVTGFQTINFIDFSNQANQGNYLMITHNAILAGPNGSAPVEEYRAYRSSAAGGGYNAKIYMIDQLTDQFAYGIKGSPLSVRNFLRFARSEFSAPPKSVFIIGKGVKYRSARLNESDPVTARLNLIPTFGEPASDMLLSAEGSSSVPLTPIGRVPVINGNEFAIYLDKIRQYDQQLTPLPGVDAGIWKKNVVHIVGANEAGLASQLSGYLNAHERIIKDTFYGVQVSDFASSTNAGAQQIQAEQLRQLLNRGVNLLTYFGHSSTESLTFNLENPDNYSNHGKYPVFHMMGCNVGDIFTLNANRLSTISTISDKYLLAKDRGSIGMMAGTALGFVSNLGQYNQQLYELMAVKGYGGTLGELMQKAIVNTFNSSGGEGNLYTRAQCEEYTLNGDPAIRLYQFDKPDYAIEDAMVTVTPAIVSVAEPNFTVRAKIANLGKAIKKDLVVELKRTYPDLSTQVVQRDTIAAVHYADSITYRIDINPLLDKGANKFTITIDPENNIDELFESNNSITKDVFIYEDEVTPIFPYNYSVVNKQNILFAASTGDPFAISRNYVMEIDTTALFNSSAKVSASKISVGGAIAFSPQITFRENTVYYWRVSKEPLTAEETQVWSKASFTYMPTAGAGFSQSHVYQFNDNPGSGIGINEQARLFYYDSVNSTITVNNKITSGPASSIFDVRLQLGGVGIQGGYMVGADGSVSPQQNSLRFYLVDNKTFNVVQNQDLGTSGKFGSYRPLPWGGTLERLVMFFQFDISTVESRNKVMSFLDSIPLGYYVGVTSNQIGTTVLPSVWQNDTTVNGRGVSLYHKFKNIGWDQLDSITSIVPYIFLYQSGNKSLMAQSKGAALSDAIAATLPVRINSTVGSYSSRVFTKASLWDKLAWDGYSIESPSTDSVSLNVLGVDKNGLETVLLKDIPATQKEVDLSFISAKDYPGLRLSMSSSDAANRSPYQLKYWRVYGTPAPEGAVAPNAYYAGKDTVDAGEPFNFGIAFKNISDRPFDSLHVKMSIRNKNNVESILPVSNVKPLLAGDTVRLNVPIDTRLLSGNNLAYLEFNPDGHQPEQFQFNNFVFKNFYVRSDSINPYLDVTFDGNRILNRDIVSSKPHILMKLTDDARYMLLNNTDLVKVQLKHPGGITRDYQFNNDTLTFIPPSPGSSDNTATVNFKPHLLEDGDYELIVTAADESGNNAGGMSYRIAFQVLNKPMISNLLNYPNPFTTSTAFVFTLTGSEIPQNMRIQILTVTGKIVREITKAELGPLRIGRNITEFKWDGTDQYGQKVGNGVYLYRVLTNLNGRSLDKYSTKDNNTDKYFNKGYGKMVLIR